MTGLVRRHNGTIVTTGGSIRLNNSPSNTLVSIGTDGRYRFTGVPAGTYTLTATLNLLPGGASNDVRLTGAATATTAAGQVTERDVLIVPTGGVTGTLRTAGGAVVTNRAVELRVGNTLHRTVTTSTAGLFLFTDVPAGVYVLMRSVDPVPGFVSQVSVTIVQDATLAQDLTFLGVGTLQVTATTADGIILSGATVRLRRSTDSPGLCRQAGSPCACGGSDRARYWHRPGRAG